MPNQKDIAKALGITQAAVSMALRGDRSISAEMRQKVSKTAKRMGYHSNAYLTVLMSHIRTGKKLSDKGVIGLLVEAGSQENWYKVESYRGFHQGVLQRGRELGFRVESFFLRQPGMNPSKIDQILHTRNIKGIILAPPYHGNRSLNLHWERYAAIGVGFGWEEQELNRVVYDSQQNFITAFNALRQMGYRRIGTVLGKSLIYGTRHGIKSYTGYLECQNSIPEEDRLPIFASNDLPGGKESSEESARFREWFLKWRPDVLLTLVGSEKQWLDEMKLKVPKDVGLACLAQPSDTSYARIDEKGEVVGATALELVAAQIARNEFGPPSHPKVMMIEGRWVKGSTLRKKTAGRSDSQPGLLTGR